MTDEAEFTTREEARKRANKWLKEDRKLKKGSKDDESTVTDDLYDPEKQQPD